MYRLSLALALCATCVMGCQRGDPANPTTESAPHPQRTMLGAASTPDAAGAPAGGETQDSAEAKAVWARDCASCHGATGKGDGEKAAGTGKKLQDFSEPAWLAKMTEAQMRTAIVDGHTPPVSSELHDKPKVVDGLIAIIRSFATQKSGQR